MNIYEKINTILGTEFDRYMRIHPEFADRIPENAHLILLLEGDEGFNKWSHQLGECQAEEGQPVVYVRIKKLGTVLFSNRIISKKVSPINSFCQ